MNCQSFIGKENALKNDFNVKGSCVVGFADTRLSTDEYVDDFGEFPHEYQLTDDTRPSLGITSFSKIEVNHTKNVIYRNNKNEKVGSCMFMQVPNMIRSESFTEHLTIIFCYVTPNCSKEVYNKLSYDIIEYLDEVNSKSCVVLGDFNRSPFEISNDFGLKLMQKNLRQIIKEITHDHGKILDHIYTNLDDNQIKHGVLESLTNSDHRPIFISVKKM